MTDPELVDAVKSRHGLTSAALARLLVRDERTVRRWLAGGAPQGSPMPGVVRRRLLELLEKRRP